MAKARSTTIQTRPPSVYLLVFLLLFLSVNALVGGGLLVADPSGGLMGMPVSLLGGSPFADYLVPGVVLFGVLGVLPVGAVWALLARPDLPALRGLEHLTREHWSWSAALAVGAALIVWIVVQMTVLSFWLQPVLLALGVAVVGVCLFPAVRRFYAPLRPDR